MSSESQSSVTQPAYKKGLMYGMASLLPSSAVVMAAMRSNAFRQNTSVPVRLALVAIPALYVSHIANSHEQQNHMAERIGYTKRNTSPSPIPLADVRDEIATLHLKQEQNDSVGVVPELKLQHRVSNAMSRKPVYVSSDDWKKRADEIEAVKGRMMDKLELHRKGVETIRHRAAAN